MSMSVSFCSISLDKDNGSYKGVLTPPRMWEEATGGYKKMISHDLTTSGNLLKLWCFSGFGSVYQCSDLLSYLLIYLLTYLLTVINEAVTPPRMSD